MSASGDQVTSFKKNGLALFIEKRLEFETDLNDYISSRCKTMTYTSRY